MSDNALRKAIEEVVNEVLRNKNEIRFDIPTYSLNTDVFTPKFGLKDNGFIEKIEFYDVPSPEKVAEINKGKVSIDSKGIKAKSKHGDILFDCDGLSFDLGVALEYIKKGLKVCRKGWNGRGMYVKLEKGGDYEFSEINPFFVIKNTSNSFNTWVPSVSDLLATDWTIYIGE